MFETSLQKECGGMREELKPWARKFLENGIHNIMFSFGINMGDHNSKRNVS